MTPAPLWMEDGLAVAPDVLRLTLAKREALFCARRQQLFELEPTLAALFDRLGAGGPAEPDSQQAQAWLQDGWLLPRRLMSALATPADAVLPMRIGDLSVRLELRGAGAPLAGWLRQAFDQFVKPATGEAVRWDVAAFGDDCFVIGDPHPARLLAPSQVVPEIKARLTSDLCRQPRDGGLLLHAALLGRGRRGLLLTGAPGAGKTTLTVALAAHGLAYHTDDLVIVSRDGGFRGVPFSPALKSGAWPLLASRTPGLADLPIHMRGDGQAVRYLPPAPAPDPDVVPAMAVVLDRQEGAIASLQPLDPLSVLTELLGSGFSAERRLPAETLARFAERCAAMHCARLVYSDLDDAVRLLASRLDEPA